jgi:molybdate transport system permease protein
VSDALVVSLRVTLIALALSAPLGAVTGFALARGRGPVRAALDAAVLVPLVLPPSVTGYYLLLSLGARSWAGAWLERAVGLRLVFTQTGAAVAAAVVALPLMAKGAEAAFARVDRGLEEVARAHGLSAPYTFWIVTLPLAAPGLAVALAVTAVRALGEFGATLTFAGYAKGETSTVPLELYVALQSGDEARAGRLSLLLVIASALAALSLGVWGRRAGSNR